MLRCTCIERATSFLRAFNALWLIRGAPTRTMRPPSAMRRERGEPERCCGAHVAGVQRHLFRACVTLLTRSRRADADYATSERDTKRARRADADYSTSEPEAKRARAHVAVNVLRARNNKCCVHMFPCFLIWDHPVLSERDAKRARRADAGKATAERDAKRARRADADHKISNPVLLAAVFS
jgi:hypothetical protein